MYIRRINYRGTSMRSMPETPHHYETEQAVWTAVCLSLCGNETLFVKLRFILLGGETEKLSYRIYYSPHIYPVGPKGTNSVRVVSSA